jgi:hypothetical protein
MKSLPVRNVTLMDVQKTGCLKFKNGFGGSQINFLTYIFEI